MSYRILVPDDNQDLLIVSFEGRIIEFEVKLMMVEVIEKFFPQNRTKVIIDFLSLDDSYLELGFLSLIRNISLLEKNDNFGIVILIIDVDNSATAASIFSLLSTKINSRLKIAGNLPEARRIASK